MKFIHTSDWHIGRQFHNVSLLEDQCYVLDQIIAYIEQQSVDAVVISGDIYDRSVPPAAAVQVLDKYVDMICSTLNVPIIMIPGNHDGAERLRFGSRQLSSSGLHILGDLTNITEPVVVSGLDTDVAFYGIPYNDPESVRNLFDVNVSNHDEAHGYLVDEISSQLSADNCNVLLSHCFIDGSAETESERPLSIGGADRVSYEPCKIFDYVALGHLHSPQYRGQESIRYSGSILKYSFSEQHQRKGVTLVELGKSGFVGCIHLPLTPMRDMRVIEGELDDIIKSGKTDPGSDDYLLVRLTDKHAVLDPMGKLRVVYPNVLHLEKPGMYHSTDKLAHQEKMKRGELQMFRDFYSQVSGDTLSESQDEIVRNVIEKLNRNSSQF